MGSSQSPSCDAVPLANNQYNITKTIVSCYHDVIVLQNHYNVVIFLEYRYRYTKILLKGQCHEIFDPRFFRQSITPRPLINTLKYFRFLFRIRRAITEYVFVQRYAA
jgi:hypothetical protein